MKKIIAIFLIGHWSVHNSFWTNNLMIQIILVFILYKDNILYDM